MTDPLRLALDDLAYAASATEDRVARVRRAVRRRRTAQLSAAGLVLVLGGGALLALPDHRRSTTTLGTDPGAGAFVDCAGAQVTLDKFTATDAEETRAGLPQDGLRAVLNHPRDVGLSGNGHWVELARTDIVVTYGRRTGAVGIDAAVALQQKPDGTWGFLRSDGCGTVHPRPGLSTQVVAGFKLVGSRLLLSWEGGGCAGNHGLHEDVVVRTESHVEEDGLHVRIVTQRNPALGPPGICAGVGLGEVARVDLAQPLGDKAVWDDSKIPPRRVIGS
jgi:hypothetical protein